jgi:hypothetical protein
VNIEHDESPPRDELAGMNVSVAHTPDPDSPPWSVGTAVLVWLASLVLMFFLPVFFIVPYIAYSAGAEGFARINETLMKDPTVLLIGVAATVPIHLLTLLLVWAVATNLGKRPFGPVVGMSWGHHFGFWRSVLTALVLLGVASLVAQLIGVNRTPFDEMLESSTAALFTTAFLATATAPLVEELVYRGMLYPALRRAAGAAFAVAAVTFLFSLVHVWQYQTSPGTIAAIVLLSLALTIVRAASGRVLPGIIIHLVFNGVQVVWLIYSYLRKGQAVPEAAAFISLAGLG